MSTESKNLSSIKSKLKSKLVSLKTIKIRDDKYSSVAAVAPGGWCCHCHCTLS